MRLWMSKHRSLVLLIYIAVAVSLVLVGQILEWQGVINK